MSNEEDVIEDDWLELVDFMQSANMKVDNNDKFIFKQGFYSGTVYAYRDCGRSLRVRE